MKTNRRTKKQLFCAMALCAASMTAQAADKQVMMPLTAAMQNGDAQAKLGDSVKFYFGDQKTPNVLEKLGSSKTSQKTNAFNKSDAEACNWVFLSSMIQLQKHAQKVGANAVINIVSNYKNNEFSSATEFECHVGTMMAGVALKGDFVKIAK
jgi:uncharacterized protein YbjQ (UPF0145 family)